MNIRFWFRQRLSATGVTPAKFDDLRNKIYNSNIIISYMPKVGMGVNIISFIDHFDLNNEEQDMLKKVVENFELKIIHLVLHKNFIQLELDFS
jgi:hypothetical protein